MNKIKQQENIKFIKDYFFNVHQIETTFTESTDPELEDPTIAFPIEYTNDKAGEWTLQVGDDYFVVYYTKSTGVMFHQKTATFRSFEELETQLEYVSYILTSTKKENKL